MEQAQEQKVVQPKSFKNKFLNKKMLMIVLIACIILGGGGFVGVQKASDNPAFCTLCHNMQSYYDSWNDSKLLANKHAAAGVNCHDCHESSISIQAEEGLKYVNNNYETPLEKRQFATEEFCTRCHDLESVKAKTNFAESNPHDNHNGEMECYTCHNMHQESKVFCQQCHSFSWYNDLPDYWK